MSWLNINASRNNLIGRLLKLQIKFLFLFLTKKFCLEGHQGISSTCVLFTLICWAERGTASGEVKPKVPGNIMRHFLSLLRVAGGMVTTPAFLGTELASALGITSYWLLASKPPQNLKQHFIAHNSVGQQSGLGFSPAHLGSLLVACLELGVYDGLTHVSGDWCFAVNGLTCL